MAAVTAPSRTAAQHQSLLHFVGEGSWSDGRVLAKVREMICRRSTTGANEAWIIDAPVAQTGPALSRSGAAILRATRQTGQLSGGGVAVDRQSPRQPAGRAADDRMGIGHGARSPPKKWLAAQRKAQSRREPLCRSHRCRKIGFRVAGVAAGTQPRRADGRSGGDRRRTDELVGALEVSSGLTEVYDVQVLPGIRRAGIPDICSTDRIHKSGSARIRFSGASARTRTCSTWQTSLGAATMGSRSRLRGNGLAEAIVGAHVEALGSDRKRRHVPHFMQHEEMEADWCGIGRL